MATVPRATRLEAARRLVAFDPLDEPARRQLMLLLAESGDRIEAIRQYEVCAELLRDELGIGPGAETRRVLAQIRQSSVASPAKALLHDERQELVDEPSADGRPVVAVLPFTNVSDDHGLGPFTDGLADDLLFALSRLRWFRVLAGTATFTIRDPVVDPLAVQRQFGATHIVSGRVRRGGNRLRVIVELTDARTGQQLWANRYDKPLDDLFDVQDEIVRRVAAGIEPALEDSEIRRILAHPPETLAAYDLRQRGYWHLYRGTMEDDERAGQCFEAALAKDSNYAGAWAGLGYVRYRQAQAAGGDSERFARRIMECRDTAARALAIDQEDPRALRYFGGASSFMGDQNIALGALRRSIELAPSYATAYSGLAFVHDFQGNFAAAGLAADQTIQLRPHDPSLYKCIIAKSIARYQTGDYAQSERIARSSLRGNASWWLSNLLLVASMGQLGRPDEAAEAIGLIRGNVAGAPLEAMLQRIPFADAAHAGHLADGIKRAGWKD